MTSRPTRERPEVLAPAGDWDALRAAVRTGADAVYFGLQGGFNARHRAANFPLEELPAVVAELHGHGVRGYVTLNTLIFTDELPSVVEVIEACARAGVDAVIVQDLGLVRLIRAVAPTLPVHGSTQMTLTEPRAVDAVAALGVERVILARELSVKEIGKIAAATPVPVEVFVHGALCVSYSGQCLTSESLGGRSANRGQCAQACRLPYDLVVDGSERELGDVAYLLSPQDLAGHDLVGDLLEAGVVSLKVEGRLKSPQYVAATTQVYREAVDAALAGRRFQASEAQRRDLAQSFSRGLSPGFLLGPDHQALVHGRFPKARGLRVGVVTGTTPRGVLVDPRPQTGDESGSGVVAAGELAPGDGLVFDEGHPEQDEQGGRVAAVEPRGELLEVILEAGSVNLSALSRGAILWKTDDPRARRRLSATFARDQVHKPTPVRARLTAIAGQAPRLALADDAGASVEVKGDAPLEVAQRQPLTAEVAREQLARLGGTPFELGELALVGAAGETPGPLPVMVPKSVLNELRRQAVAALSAARTARATHAVVPGALEALRAEVARDFAPTAPAPTPALGVLCRSLEQLDAVLAWGKASPGRLDRVLLELEDIRGYKQAVPTAKAAGVPIALATVRVIKPGEDVLLARVAEAGPDAVLVRNLTGLSFFRERFPALPLHGDYALNAANELTASLLLGLGLQHLVPSYDLTWEQLAAMARRVDPRRLELVVHQHMPMFHMEHCVFAHTLSEGRDFKTCGRPCESHRVDLGDRAGVSHPLLADVGCRNTVYNGLAQSAAELVPAMRAAGLHRFRVELLREPAAEVGPLLDRYADLLSGRDDGRKTWRRLKVLNQLGVTRGTLVSAPSE